MLQSRVLTGLAALVVCASTAVAQQETRSTIFGRVLDPQATAVPGANVVVTNTETNNSNRLKTNETGYYEANLLLPGSYQITVEADGFKKSVRSGVSLSVSARIEVTIQLELGTLAESVSVTAEAPMLDTSAVSSGRVLDNRSLMDLPVLGNNVILLAKMSPGIQHGNGVNNYVGLHSNPTANSKGGAAGNVGGNEWSIDGMPNTGSDRKTAYMPYSDTVQEFKVETSNFDASIGHSTGASFAMISKTGTNQVHGTLTEQHWQQRWNGAPFFVKQLYYRSIADAETRGDSARAAQLRSQDKQPSGRSNNYAATIGGPVVIPKLFNGKDKLFFFFAFNGFRDSKTEDANSINRTIPTMANRQGDFAQLLQVDPVRYQIYDPLSVRPDPARPTHFIRDPIPGNVIPRNRIVNPVYNAYVKLLPVPNNDPSNPRLEPRNNYVAVGTPYNWDYKAYSNRVDYNHNDNHRFFARWSWNDFMEDRGDWTYESARGLHTNGLNRHNFGGAADWVYTKSANTFFDFAVALNEFREGNIRPIPMSFKPSDMGFPAYLDAQAGDQHTIPQISVSGYQTIGSNVSTLARFRMLTGKAEVTHIRGRHTVRGGVDSRQHFRTGGGGGNTSGNYSFNNQWTRRNEDSFTPAGDFGHSWAAFMMGMPNSMTIAINDSYATHTPYYAAYVQETWRLTPTVTLNLGLRTEYEMGPTERFNRAVSYFDPKIELPISAAARAAYAAAPVPELAASQFQVLGGANYAGSNGVSRRLWQNELMWMPRAAAAWQIDSKTVIRGGYGLFYDSLNVLNDGPAQNGFSRTTSTVLTNDFGMNWLVGNPRAGVSPLTDPFPVRANGTRFDQPTRDELGTMALAGRSYTFEAFNTKHARLQRWRASLQRQFGSNMMIDIAYAGSYADRNYIERNLNSLPEQYWAKGMTRDNAIASNLNSNVTNPFRLSNFTNLQTANPVVYQDMTTQGFYTSPTIAKQRLLRPYPHMSGVAQSLAPYGKVRTDALEVSFEKRFSKGYNFTAGYTKLRDRAMNFYNNEFDAEPSWREGSFGRPHRFFASSVAELPFGRGRMLLSDGVVGHIVGGFQIGVTYEWQPGALLNWGNLFYYGETDDIKSGERTMDAWFNTANFERTSTRTPAAYHARVFPTQVPGLRQDMLNQWNVNIQREFRITEGIRFQIRGDAINLQNRSQFNAPDLNPLSTNFGRITSQTDGTNRFIQIQGRIRF